MAKECERVETCGFFKKYHDVKSLACKGFFRSYCMGELMDKCKRKEYLERHGAPPSDDMMPNGRYIPTGRETTEG